jgi:uncharacterized membrane protein HdeD (DUF308 family)
MVRRPLRLFVKGTCMHPFQPTDNRFRASSLLLVVGLIAIGIGAFLLYQSFVSPGSPTISWGVAAVVVGFIICAVALVLTRAPDAS